MEIDKVVYLSGTLARHTWDWSLPFKIHLKPYYVHDAERMRMDVLKNGEWTDADQKRQDKVKASARYEVYVLTPEGQDYRTVAEAVDAAHRRKEHCIFLALKSIQGPGFHIAMSPDQMTSVEAIEDLISDIGGRVFRQPNDVINFLLNQATY